MTDKPTACCYCGGPSLALLETPSSETPQAYCATCGLVVLADMVGRALVAGTPDMPTPPGRADVLSVEPNCHLCGNRRWLILEVKDHKHATVSACPACNPGGVGT